MIGVPILLLVLYGLNQVLYSGLRKRHRFFSTSLMNKLFWYHLLFGLVYYTYASFNPSDSHRYFERTSLHQGSWGELFGTSTPFIDFMAYPFIHWLGFNYEMMMLLFVWLGYLGFLYAYLFFRENIPVKVKVFKRWDFLTLILFLPNMHFWTSSFGKGAPIFFGLMLFAYAIKAPNQRLISLVLGSFIIYFIRPHVFFFVAVGTVIGYMFGRERISMAQKLFITAGLVTVLILAKDQILAMGGIDGSDDLLSDFQAFSSDRSQELGKSGSGVAMSSYPLPLKLFTFWYRPLFIDAPGVLGLVVSVENLLYLLLTFKLFQKGFIKFLRTSPMMVKMSLVVFFLSSLAMTFIMSNLGIIMRQKSMVMYFLFFVIYYFLAQKKYVRLKKIKKMREAVLREKQQQEAAAVATA